MRLKIKTLAIPAVFALGFNITSVMADEKPPEIKAGSVSVNTVSGPVTPRIINVDLRTLPTAAQWRSGDPIREVPRRNFRPLNEIQADDRQYSEDPLAALQTDFIEDNQRAFSDTIINIDGQGFTGVNPPDPIMDVGPNYVVQAINSGGGSQLTIYNKSDGTVAAGPLVLDQIGGSTGDCVSGAGDPSVKYDEDAGRWFIAEFTSNGDNDLCIYVSQTGDPVTGGWFAYEFQDNAFPDYPHFGVWPNAYYGTANKNSSVYAFDRVNMLAGNVARPVQTFDLTGLPGYGFQTPTPADWDAMTGTLPPPAGSPGIIMRHVDEEAHSSFTNRPDEDLLEMYEFVVDFDNAANSAVNLVNSIDITDYNSWFTNYTTFFSVPQPNGGALDPIREVILNRMQYINFGSHESIIGAFPTNLNPTTSASDVTAGLRWFELRRTGGTGGTWGLYQEGTYADLNEPTQNRFVGSVSMDSAGNIALAYSFTDVDPGNQVSPSLKYTGRMSADPLGLMTQSETDIVLGSAANASGRWGDYAAMAVDPSDGCTFWFTGEYSPASSWSTRIASFKFDACGEPGYVLTADNSAQQVCVMNGATDFTSNINLTSISGYTDDVDLAFNPALPTGFSGVFAANPVAAGGSTTLDVGIADTVTSGDYTLTLESNSVGANIPVQTFEYNVSVFDSMPGSTNLTLPADGATAVNPAVSFSWDVVPDALNYLVEVATDNQFTNIVVSETVATNSLDLNNGLQTSTEHFWRVTAQSPCGDTTSNIFSFTTQVAPGDCPVGTSQIDVYSYMFDNISEPAADLIFRDGFDGPIESPWEIQTAEGPENWSLQPVGDGGSLAYQADDLEEINDTSLVSPIMSLPTGVGPLTLRFWNTQVIEDVGTTGCYDSALLEISVNGGPFTQVTNTDIINDDYTRTTEGGFGHPLPAGTEAWCGDPMPATVFNVNADGNAGSDVQYRFRMTSDSSVGRPEGWVIDNVRITGCEVPPAN